jgi:Fic family protein
LSHALRHPGFEYTVRSHQSSHRVVNNTARADLDDLVHHGLLLKTKRGRKHVFVAPRDLDERLREQRAARD